MSLYGARESGGDEMLTPGITGMSGNYRNESNCHRFWNRLMTCMRESQELDVLYDCRSRILDMRECVVRHKQSTWVMRETMTSIRHEGELRKWLRDYDEKMGHPPLLEAVAAVRKKVDAEGGVDIMNPTVFKDPDMYIPRRAKVASADRATSPASARPRPSQAVSALTTCGGNARQSRSKRVRDPQAKEGMEQPPQEPWSSPSPLTMSGGVAPFPQPPLSGFNYRRNPALMMAEEPTPPGTITIQDARAAPTAGLRRPQCGEPHFHTANATSSSPVPPMAIPYIALHNVGWKDSNFKGRKWVIMPMVAGFESTFIANTLQGLLCLPGCESAMMGESAVTSSSDGGSRHSNASALGQDDSRRCGESGVVQQSSRSSSLAEPPPPQQQQQQQQAHEAAADDDDGLEQHSHARSASPDGADEHSLSSSVTSDPIVTEDRTARSLSEEGGDAGKGSGARRAEAVKSRDAGRSPQVLRGGIRSQWGTRVKTAASRTYAAYVMQHLSDANIQLRTPVPHDGLPSDAPVTDTQVDNAEELESLRGQSATVPRCLAPVALPKEPRAAPQVSGGSGAGKSRAHVSIFLAHEAKEDEVCTSTCGTTSAAGAEPSEPSVTTTTVASAAMPPGTASATAIAAVSPPEKAAVLMGLEEGHSSDDNNSPTPSSREEEEEEELWVSTEDTSAGQAGGAAQNAETTRMTNRQVAQDGSRYTCFASNCVDNMPNYPLPQLQSEDLVDLAAFMVVRSSLQPDEATDLHLGAHVLGNPQNVRLLPPEQRAALMSRAARLMEAAVFLQV